jgi:hypothetical protein
MFFYILLFPILLSLLLVFFNLRRMRKHDIVLFRFCQIRRDVMRIIRDKNLEISQEDYFALRDLINGLEITIHHYNECKTTLFNMRSYLKWFKEYKKNAKKLKLCIDDNSNPEIINLSDRFRFALLMAFFAYTPFIKSEATIRIFAWILNFLTKIGIKQVKKICDNFKWLLNESENFQHAQHAH